MSGDDGRVRPYTRVLAGILIVFLAIAFVLLYLLPGMTEQLFAWTITPAMTAMMLGATYAGGVVFFVHVARDGLWSRVRRGIPAVLTFAVLALAATVLHWDRFHVGHISFITWTILYIASPPLLLVALYLQRGTDTAPARGYLVPRAQRVVLAVIGAAATITGLLLFFAPALFVDSWAWQLTPLTARVIGAVLTLPGLVNVWMLVDPRWSAFRAIMQAQLVSLVLILVAFVIARDDLDWSRPATPLVVGGLAASGVAFGAVYVASERRSRR